MSFRLSEEEYNCLQEVCASRGLRCISDVARLAAQHCVASGGEGLGNGPLRELRELRGEMDDLRSEVKRLASLVEGGGKC